MGEVVVDEEFFRREVRMWYGFHDELRQHWRDFVVNATPIPELSRGLSPVLDELVPAMNRARRDIGWNMSLGQQSARLIGNALVESAQSYGMTEDEAERLSKEIP